MSFSSMLKSAFVISACAGIIGCETAKTPDTSLLGTASHTGTLTILRVDDGWRGDTASRSSYRLGDGISNRGPRFVPVRGKNDIAVFDTPDRRVTKDDFITLSLNSGFIKYFREGGLGRATGEIAMVISFDGGSTVKENILVVSSRGQTLGSFLDFTDWPIIGPVKIDGDSLRMRVVIIELDQVENDAMKNFIRTATGLAGTLAPQAAPALKIAQGIADFVISQNGDDVVFDQRFSLQRMDEGTVVTRSPLMFGKYVLVMKEDSLADNDAKTKAPTSVQTPVPDDMRYDMRSDRLYKIYPYGPDVQPTDAHFDACNFTREQFSIPPFSWDVGVGPIGWPQFYPEVAPEKLLSLRDLYYSCADYRTAVQAKINSTSALNLRKNEIGFENPALAETEILGSRDRAMKIAYLESLRSQSSSINATSEKFAEIAQSIFPSIDLSKAISFEYPVLQYPDGNVILGQYPLHTHLVLSIDRSLGGEGTAFHDQFQQFSTFLDEQKASVRDDARFAALSTLITDTLRESKNQKVHIKFANALRDDDEAKLKLIKTCYLWQNGLGAGAGTEILSDAPVYNEIFHLTGFSFNSRDDIKEHLVKKGHMTAADSVCPS